MGTSLDDESQTSERIREGLPALIDGRKRLSACNTATLDGRKRLSACNTTTLDNRWECGRENRGGMLG